MTLVRPHLHPQIARPSSIFVVFFLGILAIVTISGCKKDENPAAKLRTAKVERGNLTQTVVATGRIQPLHQIEIRSKSGGTVRNIFVEEGDWVKRGQKLLEISPEASPSEQVRAQEELHTAEVAVHQAEDKVRVARELFDKHLLPEQDYLDTQRELERTQARLSAAQSEWALIQREHIGEAAKSDGDDIVRTSTTIVAPIDGIIFTRQVDIGSSVTPTTSASGGTIVMTMGDDREIEFRGDIDEADIGKMKVGLNVRLSVQAHPGKTFNGVVTHISPVGKVDQQEQQTVFGVRALMDNSENLLRVGLSATAKIVVDERADVPIIDEMALNFKGDSVFVKIVADSAAGKTETRTVTVGISDGIRSEVTSGLEGGELVSLGAVETSEGD